MLNLILFFLRFYNLTPYWNIQLSLKCHTHNKTEKTDKIEHQEYGIVLEVKLREGQGIKATRDLH